MRQNLPLTGLRRVWIRLWSELSALVSSKMPCNFERKMASCAFKFVWSRQFLAQTSAMVWYYDPGTNTINESQATGFLIKSD